MSMSRPIAEAVDCGTTVVAAILLFMAFVALFRGDFRDPFVAAAAFAGTGIAIRLAGRVVRRLPSSPARR